METRWTPPVAPFTQSPGEREKNTGGMDTVITFRIREMLTDQRRSNTADPSTSPDLDYFSASFSSSSSFVELLQENQQRFLAIASALSLMA